MKKSDKGVKKGRVGIKKQKRSVKTNNGEKEEAK